MSNNDWRQVGTPREADDWSQEQDDYGVPVEANEWDDYSSEQTVPVPTPQPTAPEGASSDESSEPVVADESIFRSDASEADIAADEPVADAPVDQPIAYDAPVDEPDDAPADQPVADSAAPLAGDETRSDADVEQASGADDHGAQIADQPLAGDRADDVPPRPTVVFPEDQVEPSPEAQPEFFGDPDQTMVREPASQAVESESERAVDAPIAAPDPADERLIDDSHTETVLDQPTADRDVAPAAEDELVQAGEPTLGPVDEPLPPEPMDAPLPATEPADDLREEGVAYVAPAVAAERESVIEETSYKPADDQAPLVDQTTTADDAANPEDESMTETRQHDAAAAPFARPVGAEEAAAVGATASMAGLYRDDNGEHTQVIDTRGSLEAEAAEEEQRAEQLRLEKEARDQRLGLVATSEANALRDPAPLRRPGVGGFGSFGLLVLRLVLAFVLGVAAWQILGNVTRTAEYLEQTVLPYTREIAWGLGFTLAAMAVMLVLGLGVRIVGLLLAVISGAALAFLRWGPFPIFVENMEGFRGDKELVLLAIGILLFSIGGGKAGIDGAISKARWNSRQAKRH
ncbi:DoxX family membrane protein [Tessaracoccus flavescens]|uniref:DoxX family protein n=1 Tax=Tessaracoccus flavescens TaxID=399497 RepID=A0A1Q2CW21_9ACTN|nr:DoxX family membrane protein [Tessaracoccus flavescens]AQP50261.1 hypothetical protein BW733_04845 [Tessaracoccus flavescens]